MPSFFGEVPSNQTSSWQSGCNTRGSFDIISSCLITLGLCIWTCVHLNVPEDIRRRHEFDVKHSTTWPYIIKPLMWSKIGWLIIGMLAPEMIAFTAWVQRRQSHKLTKKMKSLLENAESDTEATNQSATFDHTDEMELGEVQGTAKKGIKRRHKWTEVHSFFAVMGGFAIGPSNIAHTYLPESRDWATLSREGLLLLAELRPSAIPDISADSIKDKSKADSLTKCIVCLQALWFSLQCIARWQQGLSISLLELNTLVHCLCALLIYSLWWHKPLDIEVPTIITDESVHELGALFCFKSTLCFDYRSFQLNTGHFLGRRTDYRMVRFINAIQLKDLLEMHSPGTEFKANEARSEALQTALSQEISDQGQKLMKMDPNIPRIQGTAVCPAPPVESALLWYTTADRRRWNLAFLASLEFPKVVNLPDGSVNLVQDRIGNLPIGSKDFNFTGWFQDGSSFIFAFTLAGIFYGGMHLLAWDAPFATRVQQVLWRVSGITIVSTGPIFLLAKVVPFIGTEALVRLYDRFSTETERMEQIETTWMIDSWTVLVWLPLFLVVLLYISARVYLVVQSFLSLVHLPSSIFVEPSWSGYWPHLQ